MHRHHIPYVTDTKFKASYWKPALRAIQHACQHAGEKRKAKKVQRTVKNTSCYKCIHILLLMTTFTHLLYDDSNPKIIALALHTNPNKHQKYDKISLLGNSKQIHKQ